MRTPILKNRTGMDEQVLDIIQDQHLGTSMA